MIYKEIKKDLFTEKGYYVHCIASDLGMGAGIAVPMQKKFGLRSKIYATGYNGEYPTCILTGTVFNLITKHVSRGKPTYESLETSLYIMRDIVIAEDIKTIASPKFGAGLDRLNWDVIRDMIKEIFEDLDITWTVCYL